MKTILVSFMMVFALVSCSTEELGNGNSTPASNKGGVQLVLSTDGFNEVGSRAVDESVIHDVNILQYVNGALRQQVYLDESKADFSKAVEVSGLEEAPATLMDDATDADGNKVKVMQENGIENFVFIVANYGSQIDRTQVPSLAKLKAFAKKFSGKTTMENLPMTGFYYGGVNPTSTTQMSVTLQRAVAKINFTLDTSSFKVGGRTPSLVAVNSIKLCNVPDSITFYPCRVRPSLPKNGKAGEWNFGVQSDGTLFPKAKYMEKSSVTYDDDQNQSSTANTYVAYIPENARGSYSNITDNKDKHPSKCDGSIDESTDKSYTYILVDLDYALADGTTKKATYKIYLGGNSTGDMNLLRNTQYNVTTSLYGANDADTRIKVTDASGIIFLDAANCYMIDMNDVKGGNKNIIIPLSQVNKGWEKIAEYDATQSTTKTQVAEMLKSGKWEIKTLWKTWQGSNITGAKVADLSDDNLKAALAIPADIPNGNNAVVELVSTENNNVYWSWHLWFTDYKPNESTDAERKGQVHKYTASQTKYMMDRNLGAITTGEAGAIARPASTSEAVKYYGLMYQFGRKDPFVGSGNGSSSFVAIYKADDTPLSNGATPPFNRASGSGSTSFLANAVKNPFAFYIVSDGNWTKEDDLWDKSGSDKSVFDPCPPGWRVPTNNIWASFTSNFTWGTTATGTGGSMYTGNNVQAWFPGIGNVSFNGGVVGSVGGRGNYWSATPNGSSGYSLSFDVRYSPVSYPRAFGFAVRCIQE